MRGLKGEHLRRVGWFLLAMLFVLTGLGVGIYAFWVNTHQSKSQTTQTHLIGSQLKNFTPVDKVESLQKIDKKIGSGTEAKESSIVTLNYSGAVAATGMVFDSSYDRGQPVQYPLNQFVPGFAQGVEGMKAGGQRRILIPAALAYGNNPPAGSGIPANADLVFDVSLISAQ